MMPMKKRELNMNSVSLSEYEIKLLPGKVYNIFALSA
jgi:hypothetical protein